MRKIIIAVVCCVMSTGALAQGPQASAKYAPIDEDLWRTLVQGISEVPMGYNSHQEIFRLLNSVQLEAQKRAAAKEAPKAAAPTPPPATPAAPTPAKK